MLRIANIRMIKSTAIVAKVRSFRALLLLCRRKALTGECVLAFFDGEVLKRLEIIGANEKVEAEFSSSLLFDRLLLEQSPPGFIALLVGVIAFGAIVFYSSLLVKIVSLIRMNTGR